MATTAQSAKATADQAAAYGKKAMEDHLAIAKKLATAKSAMDAYVSELTRFSDSFTASMQRAVKPLNERFAAAAEQFATR